MNPAPKPDPDLEAILAAFKADEEDEAAYRLLAATHDEDEGKAIEAKRLMAGMGQVREGGGGGDRVTSGRVGKPMPPSSHVCASSAQSQ